MPTPKATPSASVPAASRNLPGTGRTLSSMAAALQRGLIRVESALVKTLDAPYNERGRAAACLEAALLLRLRRGLSPYLREPSAPGKPSERIDGVLADGLLESVDAAVAVVADLEGEPAGRYGRWLSFCRELTSELVALGAGDVSTEKRMAETLQQRLQDAAKVNDALATDLGNFFAALSARLEQTSPLVAPTLLDEVLRRARATGVQAATR